MDKCEIKNLIISDVTGCSLWRGVGKIALIRNGISESRYRQPKACKSKAVPHSDFTNAGGVACNV